MMTSNTPEECAWGRGVDDATRAIELAQALWSSGDGHRTLPRRSPFVGSREAN